SEPRTSGTPELRLGPAACLARRVDALAALGGLVGLLGAAALLRAAAATDGLSQARANALLRLLGAVARGFGVLGRLDLGVRVVFAAEQLDDRDFGAVTAAVTHAQQARVSTLALG